MSLPRIPYISHIRFASGCAGMLVRAKLAPQSAVVESSQTQESAQ